MVYAWPVANLLRIPYLLKRYKNDEGILAFSWYVVHDEVSKKKEQKEKREKERKIKGQDLFIRLRITRMIRRNESVSFCLIKVTPGGYFKVEALEILVGKTFKVIRRL